MFVILKINKISRVNRFLREIIFYKIFYCFFILFTKYFTNLKSMSVLFRNYKFIFLLNLDIVCLIKIIYLV